MAHVHSATVFRRTRIRRRKRRKRRRRRRGG